MNEQTQSKFWWLDPDGKHHRVPMYGHWDWGFHFLTKMKGVPEQDVRNDVYGTMAEHGWFRLVLVEHMGKKIMEYDVPPVGKPRPTDRQRKAIKDLAIEEGADEIMPIYY